VFRFRGDWDEEDCEEKLREYLAADRAQGTDALVIGSWSGDDPEKSPAHIISLLVENKQRLPNLRAIYLGDIVSEENEMSWIAQTNLSPLLENFPDLEYLRSRGSMNLKFTSLSHEKLRALALETGGLDVSVLRSICTAHLPALEHLEIWLGVEDYQGNCTVEDLQPILSGAAFPNLKYLGIRNYQHIDAVCSVLVSAPIVRGLEVLDLSLGLLTDVGAQSLLKLPTDTSLKKLILNHHYMSSELVEKLQQLPFDVETGDVQEDDDGWRYVAVGE